MTTPPAGRRPWLWFVGLYLASLIACFLLVTLVKMLLPAHG